MKILKNIICIVFIILSCVISSYAQDNYSYTLSSTIEFVINTDNIIQNQNYNYYINEIIPTIEKNKDNIENILLIGSASPEGNYYANTKLANKRADKIYSYISNLIPRNKIIVNNNYSLFLSKTGYDESDWQKLRATYIEIHIKENEDKVKEVFQKDTIYIRDTLIREVVNNYYYHESEKIFTDFHTNPVFSVYNDLTSDLLLRANIGAEFYFSKMSFFIEGSFSKWPILGKEYNIDLWHTGFRKYFNDDYNRFFAEVYLNTGYFDTEILGDIGKIGIFFGGGIGVGWVFELCNHWKIYPIIRFGICERVYYADYYYTEQGNINITFGNYSNGQLNNIPGNQEGNNENNIVITTSKTITKEFIQNSNKMYYFGPTYFGIVLKKDFCINKKRKQTR